MTRGGQYQKKRKKTYYVGILSKYSHGNRHNILLEIIHILFVTAALNTLSSLLNAICICVMSGSIVNII